MDPAIQAFTIRPSDWAALLGGVVEGLSYDLAAITSIGVMMAVLMAAFGRRGRTPEPVETATAATDRPDSIWFGEVMQVPGPLPARSQHSVVLIASGPYAIQLGRRNPRTRRRARRRAAVYGSLRSIRY
jgi:hypothetical protein